MLAKKILKVFFGVCCSFFFLWLVFRHIDFRSVGTTMALADIPWLMAAVAVFFVGYSFRIERWKAMLEHEAPHLRWKDCAGPYFASIAANNVIPFRAGDIMRCFAFNKRMGTSSGVMLASLFVERLLDMLALLLFLGLGLLVFDSSAGLFFTIGGPVIICAGLAGFSVFLWPGLVRRIAVFFTAVAGRFSPTLEQKIMAEVDGGLKTLRLVSARRTLARLVLLSLGAWLAEGTVFWCTAMSLAQLPFPGAAWLAFPVGTLSTLVPSTPGYVGTFDFFTSKVMMEFGNTADVATAFALLVHIVLWLPATLAGGGFFLTMQGKRNGAKKSKARPLA